jgi:hypothetical protein
MWGAGYMSRVVGARVRLEARRPKGQQPGGKQSVTYEAMPVGRPSPKASLLGDTWRRDALVAKKTARGRAASKLVSVF